jgi:butyrate kinase
VLAINPGSTSTKFGIFAGVDPLQVETVRHADAELAPFRNRPILDQLSFRAEALERALGWRTGPPSTLAAVAGRGGLLPPLASGTYLVTDAMLDHLREARRGEHASNLGAFLARSIADRAGVSAYVVDPVSVDEWTPVARLSGSALLERECLSHALNAKAVAKRFAARMQRHYDALRLVVAHLGSGISVSAHEGGRMIDVTNSREEGAFSTERAGSVPAMKLAHLCFTGGLGLRDIERALFTEGGLASYLGTRDLAEVERRIVTGDARATLVFEAMAYQIAKEIGAMATVLRGRVDAVLLTGGMAHSRRLVDALREAVGWIGEITVFPGEDELQALVEGVLRVLGGEENARAI